MHTNATGARSRRWALVGGLVVLAVAVVLSVSATPVHGQELEDDRFEPNQFPDNATELVPGNYTGLTAGNDDWDLYEFEADEGDRITVTIFFDSSDGDLDLRVRNPAGVTERADGTNDDETVSLRAEHSGTYRVTVSTDRPVANEYDLSIRVEEGYADSLEPNDALEEATPIEERSYHGLVIQEGESDFYAVEVDRGDRLGAEATFEQGHGNLDLAIHDPDGSALVESTSFSNDESAQVVATESGTYYLRVWGAGTATNEYDLSVSVEASGLVDRFEPNGRLDSAARIEPGNYSELGILGGETDYYAIDLAEGEELSASRQLEEPGGELEVAIVDADGERLASADSGATNATATVTAPADGTYYIAVSGVDGATSTYDLSVSVGPSESDSAGAEASRLPGFGPLAATVGLLGGLLVAARMRVRD